MKAFTANSITADVTAVLKDLQVSHVFVPDTAKEQLVENCKDKTLWDNNVNSKIIRISNVNIRPVPSDALP